MKKVLGVLLFLTLAVTLSYGKQGKGMERIHAAKMAYIIDRLHLRSDQSARFVPVYNEYEQELRTIRKQYLAKYNIKEVNGDVKGGKLAARKKLEEDLDYQQQVIELKRRYNDRFLTVLSSAQLSELYVAEKEFKQRLLQKWRKQHK